VYNSTLLYRTPWPMNLVAAKCLSPPAGELTASTKFINRIWLSTSRHGGGQGERKGSEGMGEKRSSHENILVKALGVRNYSTRKYRHQTTSDAGFWTACRDLSCRVVSMWWNLAFMSHKF